MLVNVSPSALLSLEQLDVVSSATSRRSRATRPAAYLERLVQTTSSYGMQSYLALVSNCLARYQPERARLTDHSGHW